MKILIWAGVQLIGTIAIWSLALAVSLITEASLHLPAGITLTPHHGTRNFVALGVALGLTVLLGVFNAIVVSEMKS